MRLVLSSSIDGDLARSCLLKFRVDVDVMKIKHEPSLRMDVRYRMEDAAMRVS